MADSLVSSGGANFDLGPLRPHTEWQNPDSHDGTFAKAVARGTDELQGGLYSAAKYVGEISGIDPLAKWGEEGFKQNLIEAANNPAEIGTWDNVHSLADFGTYVIEALGTQVPNLATMVAGGGAGALAARAAIGKAAAQRLGLSGAERAAMAAGPARAGALAPEALAPTAELLGKNLATKAGAAAGAATVNYPMQVGETYQQLDEAGIDAPGTVALAGALKTVLDTASLGIGIGQLFKGLDKEMSKDLISQLATAYVDTGIIPKRALLGPIAKQGAAGALTAGPAESVTESLQAVIDNAARAFNDPNFDPFGEEALKNVRESAIQALIVGAVPGGAGRAGTAAINLLTERANALSQTLGTPGAGAVQPDVPPAPPAAPPPTAPAPESVPEQHPVVEPGRTEGAPEAPLTPPEPNPTGDMFNADELGTAPAATEQGGVVPEEAPVLPTEPEPSQDIVAQVNSLKQGETRYFAGSTRADLTQLLGSDAGKFVFRNGPGGAYAVLKGEGVRLAKDLAKLKKSETPDAELGKEVLGYQQSKDEIPAESAAAVVGKDDAGAVVHSELVDGAKPAVVEAAKTTATERGATDVQVQTPVEAVTERSNRVREEGDYIVLPDRAYHKDVETAPQVGKQRFAASLSPRERIAREFAQEEFASRPNVLDPDELNSLEGVRESQTPIPWTDEITYGKDPETGSRLEGKHVREIHQASFNARAMKLFHYLMLGLPTAQIKKLMKSGRYTHGLVRETDSERGIIKLSREFPDRQFRGEGENPQVYSAFTDALNSGERSRKVRSEWTHALLPSNRKGREGHAARIRIDGKALARIGRALRESGFRENSILDVARNIEAALGFMMQHGFVFEGTPAKEIKTYQSKPGRPAPNMEREGAGLEKAADGGPVDSAVMTTLADGTEVTWGYIKNTLPKLINDLHASLDSLTEQINTAQRAEAEKTEVEALKEQRKKVVARLRDLGEPTDYGWDENVAKEKVETTVEERSYFDPARLGPDPQNPNEVGRKLTLKQVQERRRAGKPVGVTHDLETTSVPKDEVMTEPPKAIGRLRTDFEATDRAEGNVDPDEATSYRETINGKPDLDTDTSALETDAQQARDSAETVGRGPKDLQSELLAELTTSLTDTGVIGRGSEQVQRLATIAGNLLAHLGLGKPAVIVTDGTEHAGKKTSGKDYLSVLEATYPHLKDAIAGIRRDKPLGRIIFPNREAAAERVPIIYISPDIKDDFERARVMLHELGHLVEKLAYDTAPQNVKDALLKEFGSVNFHERFADALEHWVGAKEEPRTIVGQFFQGLAKLLRQLWAKFFGEIKGTKAERQQMAFNDFVDALVTARRIREGANRLAETARGTEWARALVGTKDAGGAVLSPVPAKADSQATHDQFDYTPADAWAATTEVIGARRAKQAETAVEALKVVAKTIKSTLFTTLGDYLHETFPKDSRIHQVFTDLIYKRPGDRTSNAGQVLYQLYDSMGFDKERHEIRNGFPQKRFFRRATAAERAQIQEINEQAHSDGPLSQTTNPVAKMIRSLVAKINSRAYANGKNSIMFKYETSDGVKHTQAFANDQLPYMVDSQKLGLHKKDFIKAMTDAGWTTIDAEYYHGQLANLYPAFIRLGKNPGIEFSDATEALQSRAIPPEVAPFLKDYVVEDALTTLEAYHDYMIRAAAVHKLFGLSRTARNDKATRDLYEAAEISISSPTARLDMELKQMFEAREISEPQYKELLTSLVPQALGRVPINPLFRLLNSTIVAWMNWAKMPLSLLSQPMDIGVIAHQFQTMYQGENGQGVKMVDAVREMKKHMTKAGREYNFKLLRALGIAHESSILHMMADGSVGTAALTPWANRANETLFKYNGMRWWSNMMRSISMNMAIQQVRLWANLAQKGDAHAIDALEQLGIDPTEAATFDRQFDARAESLMSYTTNTKTVRDGIMRLIDETALRPNPALRPRWANNPHLVIFWHLKAWLWAYHNVILKPVLEAAKQKPHVLMALPVLFLALHTLGFAALGYGLRELISQRPEQFRVKGFGQGVWQIAQRSGIFGVYQMVIDAIEAGQYGRSPLMSPLGPFATTIDDLIKSAGTGSWKNVGRSLERAAPLGQLVRAGHRALE